MRKITTLLLSLGIAFSIVFPASAYSGSALKTVDLGVSNAVKAAQAATTWIECKQTFIVYPQTENHCGAACVRMVLQALNGSAPDEATVAQTVRNGTYTSASADKMVNYINHRISGFSYKKYLPNSLSSFKTNVYNTIVNKHAPVIVLVQMNVTSTNSGWPISKTTGGLYSHFVVIKGISSDKKQVRIADPYDGKCYTMSTSKVYNSMHDDYEYKYKSGTWYSYCYLAAS